MIKATWKKFQFWRSRRETVLLGCCVISFSVLLMNVVGTAYLRSRFISDPFDGEGHIIADHIFFGSCQTASRISLGLHALINVLSTLTLASSNLCVQLLQAPTRREVDKAHREHRWLDIGVQGLRNFRHIPTKRRVTWIVLVTMSLPLHLLYNSAISTSTPISNMQLTIVTPDYLQGAAADAYEAARTYAWRRNQNLTGLAPHSDRLVSQRIDGFNDFNLLYRGPASPCYELEGEEDVRACERPRDDYKAGRYNLSLTPEECLHAYTDPFGDHASVIMISGFDILSQQDTIKANASNSLLFTRSIYQGQRFDFWGATRWQCGWTNSFDCRPYSPWRNRPDLIKDWNVLGWRIDHCYAMERPVDNLCKVNLSIPIMIAVCCSNLLKFVCIMYTAIAFRRMEDSDVPLTILGDALDSFLDRRDQTTQQLVLVDKKELKGTKSWNMPGPRLWTQKVIRRSQAVSIVRRLASGVGLFALLTVGCYFIGGMACNQIALRSGSVKHVFDIGFGSIDASALGQLALDVNNASKRVASFWAMIFFVNMWQLLISILYMLLNGYMTNMCVEIEWQSYAIKRKALRVTAPARNSQQRGTYFVSLPARYGIPFQMMFAGMHFTLSQGMFVLIVETRDQYNNALLDQFPYFASSPKPLFTTIGLACVLIVGLLIFGARKLPLYLPVGGTCSAVISAAAHPPHDDRNAAREVLQWGALTGVEMAKLDRAGHYSQSKTRMFQESEAPLLAPRVSRDHNEGHCCFTTYDVALPQEGEWYT